MRPADLLATTEFVLGALRPVTDRDWSGPAIAWEWDHAAASWVPTYP